MTEYDPFNKLEQVLELKHWLSHLHNGLPQEAEGADKPQY